MRRHAPALTLVSLLGLAAATRLDAAPPVQDLKSLSIEELMQVDVMLASRQAEPLAQTEAAVSVVTADDIRRSGVTTLADALGLAEGVYVARQNNGTWLITARGFDAAANKMLVMVDRRTEFSPFFAGVFWNMLDYPLEDIERIEVIRGPSATLWGANAVNGVINIITRHSRDTRGLTVSAAAGNEDTLTDVRWGGGSGNVNYRIYGKYAARDAQAFSSGLSSGDTRRRGQAGFRIDGGGSDGNQWLLKGDAFVSDDEFPDRPDGEFSELALQGRRTFLLHDASRLEARGYYRREYRRVPNQFTYYLNTVDVDIQYALSSVSGHQLVWGGGYRIDADHTFPGPAVAFEPPQRTYPIANVFLQDDIVVRANRVFLSPGLKVEYNAFSGFELQPSVRVRFQPAPLHTIWAAVSRATRRPTRLDSDVRTFAPTGALVVRGSGDDYTSEKLFAAEIGYRVQPAPRLSIDATVFSHDYNDLRSQELPATGPPIVTANTLNGRASGVELASIVQLAARWRMRLWYTLLDVEITRDPGSRDIGGGSTESNDPRHQFGMRHSIDLPHNVEVDGWLRTIGALPNPSVPGYTELNLRLGWRPTRQLELSLAGQDLLHDHHPEFGPPLPTRVEFQRSLRALLTIRR